MNEPERLNSDFSSGNAINDSLTKADRYARRLIEQDAHSVVN